MGKVIAISNRKGGVGKTTTTIQLADILSNDVYGCNLKILGIDFDVQGSWTTSLQLDVKRPGIYDLIINGLDTRVRVNKNFDFVSANKANKISNELSGEPLSELRFADAIADIKEEYDLILIDCPPEEDFMNNSAYAAADSIIVPIGTDRYSIEGVAELLQRVNTIRKLNPTLQFEGILLTRANKRTNSFKDSLADAKECAEILHTRVFESAISSSTIVDMAQKQYQTVTQYAPKSKVAKEYSDMVQELLE